MLHSLCGNDISAASVDQAATHAPGRSRCGHAVARHGEPRRRSALKGHSRPRRSRETLTLCTGSLALASARLPRAEAATSERYDRPPGPSRIIPANSKRIRCWEEIETASPIDELAEYLDFRVAKLELRLHRSPCCALEPAERPHEQKDRDWNAQ